MNEKITKKDLEKLEALTALLGPDSNPNLNALASIARNVSLLSLNIKQMGYELARQLAAAQKPFEGNFAHTIDLFCKASTQADIETAWVQWWCGQLKIPVVFHRKVWELAYVLQAIFEEGHMRPGARGLGFGCGEEPLPSYLAARGVTVTVTDLPGEDAAALGWINTQQHTDSLAEVYRDHLVDRATFDEHVSLRHVDMNAIPGDLTDYDFCWSVCAMEHLGSIEKGCEFVENLLRTLRPGGLSVHTTEFNIDPDGDTIDNWPTVLFQRRHFEELAERLKAQGHNVAPFNFDLGNKPLDRFIDLPPFPHDLQPGMNHWLGEQAHIKVGVDGFVATCFGLVVRKAK